MSALIPEWSARTRRYGSVRQMTYEEVVGVGVGSDGDKAMDGWPRLTYWCESSLPSRSAQIYLSISAKHPFLTSLLSSTTLRMSASEPDIVHKSARVWKCPPNDIRRVGQSIGLTQSRHPSTGLMA